MGRGTVKFGSHYERCRNVMHVKFTHDILLGRSIKILLLLKPGRDRSVTVAKVSNTS